MSAWSWPPRAPASLDCSHCGDVAIESPDGLFGEDDGDACMTCGHPGHVSIEEIDDEDEDVGLASWSVSDEGRCNNTWCHECDDRARAEASR